MRAVVLDVPESVLEDRRRKGLDGRDEQWEGELHMVPPAGGPHQRLSTDLILALGPVVKGLGLRISAETGLFATADDYRVPDSVVSTEAECSDRGVEGAVLVVEIRSPGDETDAKLPWYAARGVGAVLTIEPTTRTVELYVSRSGLAVLVSPDEKGWVTVPSLGVRLATGDGPVLLLDRGQGDVVEL